MELVGPRNAILWGLSQGCAAALVTLLTWDGEPLGAFVGMCGWLPLRMRMEDVMRDERELEVSGEKLDDPFGTDVGAGEGPGPDPAENAVNYLLKELRMEKGPNKMAFQRVPMFLGHGVEDDKVFMSLGREAAGCLKALGVHVRWKEYEGLAHWYSKDMLHDIKDFLNEQLDDSHLTTQVGI